MKLIAEEIVYVRSQGLYLTEKCDGCEKVLNQTFRYTITGKPEVYCSAACRDFAFFGDRYEANKRANSGNCAYCAGTLKGKRRDALYCDDVCKKRANRKAKRMTVAEVEKAGKPTLSSQGFTGAKLAIAQPARNAASLWQHRQKPEIARTRFCRATNFMNTV